MRRRRPWTAARLRRRRVSLAAAWTTLVLILASIALDQLGAFGKHDSSDWAAFDRKTVHVARVVDGDTIRVVSNSLSGEETIVRLLGIDAPESDMYWGDRATEYMRARALNRPVTLHGVKIFHMDAPSPQPGGLHSTRMMFLPLSSLT